MNIKLKKEGGVNVKLKKEGGFFIAVIRYNMHLTTMLSLTVLLLREVCCV